jgi:hypothetical protein
VDREGKLAPYDSIVQCRTESRHWSTSAPGCERLEAVFEDASQDRFTFGEGLGLFAGLAFQLLEETIESPSSGRAGGGTTQDDEAGRDPAGRAEAGEFQNARRSSAGGTDARSHARNGGSFGPFFTRFAHPNSTIRDFLLLL